jgi:hypothetical protein
MTTEDDDAGAQLERLKVNLGKVEELSQRMVVALSQRKPADPALSGPSQEVYLKAAAAYVAEMMQNPAKIMEHQVSYWAKTLKHYVEAQQVLAQGHLAAPPDSTPKDRRFANPLWDTHPFFNYIKQQYLLNAEAVDVAVAGLENMEPADKKRVAYFSRQIVDLFAPTNFLATNPDALTRADRDRREKPCSGAGKPRAGYRGERGRSAGHLGRPRGLPCRREHRDHAWIGRLSQQDAGTDPVRADDAKGPRDAAADLSAVDQQVLRDGSQAAEQPDQVDRRPGVHPVRGQLGQPRPQLSRCRHG